MAEARQLTAIEQDFADTLADALTKLMQVQEKAAAVIQSGGDCKSAFLSVVSDEDRPSVEMQWPMISLMLGVM